MVKRIITAIAIIACVLPPLLFGGILNNLLVGLVIIMGGMELCALLPGYKKASKLCYIIPLVLTFVMLFLDMNVAIALLGLLTLALLAIPVFSENFTSQDAIMESGIMVMLYVFGSAYLSIYALNPMYIWFIVIATYACDTGAYFTGYFLGKHKLCERISPKKTIEGSIGGILLSWILSFLFVTFVFKDANATLTLASGALIPFVSQIGDLSFSAIKRMYGIKDFSNIFPGHGGFMDRLDSLVFDLVLFYALMVVIL